MKIFISTFLFSTVVLANSLDSMSEKLIELRAEVDQLSSSIQLERIGNSKEITSLAVQKGNLQSSIDKERLRIKEIQQTITKYQKELEVSEQDLSELTPILQESSLQLQQYINTSLPFQKAERLKDLSRLQEQLKIKSISPSQALAKLWSLYEDEFRLARDSGLHRQAIEIGGGRELVDVIHLGMFSLYYRNAHGEVGVALQNQGQWRFTAVSESQQRKDLTRLFDSFEKKVRVGRFDLRLSNGGVL